MNEKSIKQSWILNAKPWIKAIANNEIQSRVLVTNQAVNQIILDYLPKTVLDIGCGEGWLCRQLNQSGIQTLGIDMVPEFIDRARQLSNLTQGKYELMSYDQLAAGELDKRFDLAVCNFSLIGKESVEQLILSIRHCLNTPGYLIIQTLHPDNFCDSQAIDGWLEGDWTGFSKEFTQPAPWYFRCLESWERLFEQAQLKLISQIEPVLPKTNKKASIIFVLRPS